MSDLDNAINSINASAAKAENTAGFLDDMSTFDDQSSVTNPNNGQTVASIPKQVKDRTDELFTAAESDINQAVDDAAQSATDAQDAADSIGRYQGLWPDSGGSANKGDTYQTQVSGAPAGQYFTALQNTTVDPVNDDVNWREVVSTKSLGGLTNYQSKSVADMISGITLGANVRLSDNQYWFVNSTIYKCNTNTTPAPNGTDDFTLLTSINVIDHGAVSEQDSTQALKDAINLAHAIGSASGVVIDIDINGGPYLIDVSGATSYAPAIPLKNYVKIKGSGTLKAMDGTYSSGNPAILGNEQSVNGNKEIYVEGIEIDANATNNIGDTGGAISVLFGRPVGPSGGPGAVGVARGHIKGVRFKDTSFIAAQVKNESDQIEVSDLTNNGGHYAVQASNSTQIDISTIKSKNTLNNAVDVYGNNGEKFNISSKTGTFEVGDTVTGGVSGSTGRLLQDNGSSLQVDTISASFTAGETITGSNSGATALYDSREFVKGNFSGSIRGVHADGCLTGVFLESVSDVPVSDCVIKNPAGNGCIINRINSTTSGNRVTNFTVENAGSAGLLYSGEVTDNHCEISVDGADDGVRFNGSSYNSASNCKIKNVNNGYKLTGTGNLNRIESGSVNSAATGVNVQSASQGKTIIDRPLMVGVSGSRLLDLGVDTQFIPRDEDVVVEVDGGSNITPNLDSGSTFQTTINTVSSNITINAPSGAKTKGRQIKLLLKQDGTGGNTVTLDPIYKLKTPPSTVANRRSNYTFVYNGTFFECDAEVVDF